MPVGTLGDAQMMAYACSESPGSKGAADVDVISRLQVQYSVAADFQRARFSAEQQQRIGSRNGWQTGGFLWRNGHALVPSAECLKSVDL